MHLTKKLIISAIALLGTLFLSISFASPSDSNPKICAAVRGNGAKLFVHMSTLAKMHEQYGMLWGISGGSSASVVSYLVDSIYTNPLLAECDGQTCNKDEVAARAALLLKSVEAYSSVLSEYPEMSEYFVSFLLMSDLQAANIKGLLISQPEYAVKTFKTIISSPKYAQNLNPEILQTVESASNPAAIIEDLIQGMDDGRLWQPRSTMVFLRPGATSFNVLSDILGRVGSFYASEPTLSDRNGMLEFFKNCAAPGRDLAWSELTGLKSGNTTCGAHYASLLGNYYKQSKDMGAEAPKQTKYKVGSSLHVLASVSQIEGKSATTWKEARNQYFINHKVQWTPDFEDWYVGYAGQDADLDLLLKNHMGYKDLKTSRARVIREMTWKEMLNRSPAEPSVSRAIEMNDGTITTGGWMDSQPVQALKNIGCDKVVLLDSTYMMQFHKSLAKLLGATDVQIDKLFSNTDPLSSVSSALKEADGLLCTNFNKTEFKNIQEMSEMGWDVTLSSNDPYFLKPRNSKIKLNENVANALCY